MNTQERAVMAVIDKFEARERGLPQAHIAAKLVTEMRAALAAGVEPALPLAAPVSDTEIDAAFSAANGATCHPTPHERDCMRRALEGFAAGRSNHIPDAGKMMPAGVETAVPDGWKLAPVEPTRAMVTAAKSWLANYQHMRDGDKVSARAQAYRAMLAAAPQVSSFPSTPQPATQPAWDEPSVHYEFTCYSCAQVWEARTPDADCANCGTTNHYSAKNTAPQPAAKPYHTPIVQPSAEPQPATVCDECDLLQGLYCWEHAPSNRKPR